MRRSARQRVTAGLLAVLAQGTFIAIYSLRQEIDPEREADSVRLIVIGIPALPAPQDPPLPERRMQAPTVSAVTTITGISTMEPAPDTPPTTSPIITPSPGTPRIEWYSEMQTTTRRHALEAEEAQHDNPLDSKPRVIDMPAENTEAPTIKADRLDNGDLVVRYRVAKNTTVVCVHRQVPLGRQFEALARSAAALCRATGSGEGSKAGGDISSLKPRYLQKPLPRPGQTKDRNKDRNKVQPQGTNP